MNSNDAFEQYSEAVQDFTQKMCEFFFSIDDLHAEELNQARVEIAVASHCLRKAENLMLGYMKNNRSANPMQMKRGEKNSRAGKTV